jgi:DNA polymerase IV (DinB-like DNA polymerase)
MAIGEALQKLPRMEDADMDDPDAPDPGDAGYYRPVDMDFYKATGEAIREILDAHADTLEPVSIDEAYLDVTSQTTWSDVKTFAEALSCEIGDEIGVTASVGVAPTKSAAKIASDYDKPDGLVVVEPGTVKEFLEPLDVERVHGIGPVTADTLRVMGIETAGDLVKADPDRLEAEFGARGREVHQRARGHDPRQVTVPDDPKSMSNESSFNAPVTDMNVKRDRVSELAEEVTSRAQKENALYQSIGIKVVTPPFEVNTRAHTLSGPVRDSELVESTALDLLEEFAEHPVRKVGVRVSNLSFSERAQATLTAWERNDNTNPGELSGRGTSRRVDTRETQAKLTDYT